MITGDVKLQVKLPPSMDLERSNTTVIGTTGLSAEMTCNADGFPLPRITWMRKDETVMSSGKRTVKGNTIRLTDLKKEDRGEKGSNQYLTGLPRTRWQFLRFSQPV